MLPLAVAAGALAAVPVIVSVIRALSAGWVPVGDRAIIAARSFDVLTLHPPLLGQYSASGGSHEAHSLGPMLYWLLALPVHFFADAASPLVMGAINVACVIGIVFLARRRGGEPLMLAVAIGLAAACGSLPAEIYHDTWNPSAGLLPLALLFFIGWSVACGEHRLLALMVVIASFVVQCHLTFVPPAMAVLAIALAGLGHRRGWFQRLRSFGRGVDQGPAQPHDRGFQRSVWIAAALALVCWAPPLIEQAVHRPGNVVAVLESNGGPKVGLSAGWHVVVKAVGVPPWWLTSRQSVGDRISDALTRPPLLGQLSAALLLVALAALLVLAVRRRRDDIVAGAAIALGLLLALASVAALTPLQHLLWLTLGYTLWWGSLAGMFAWLVLGWGAWTLLSSGTGAIASRLRSAAGGPGRNWVGRVAALVALVAAATVVAAAEHRDLNQSEYGPVRALIERVLARIPNAGVIRLERTGTSDAAYNYESALVYAFRHRGQHVVSHDLGPLLGTGYSPQNVSVANVLVISTSPSGAVSVRVNGRS